MLARTYVDDFTDAELLVRSVPQANHIAWQFGHMIAGTRQMLAMLGHPAPELPDGFAAAHGPEAAKSDDPKKFATKAEYFALADQMKAATLAAIDATPDSALDQPAPEAMREYAPTVAAALTVLGAARDDARRPVRAGPPQARQADLVLMSNANFRHSRFPDAEPFTCRAHACDKPVLGFIPAHRGAFSIELAAKMRDETVQAMQKAGIEVVVPSPEQTKAGCVRDPPGGRGLRRAVPQAPGPGDRGRGGQFRRGAGAWRGPCARPGSTCRS